jgi:hypothetical protein
MQKTPTPTADSTSSTERKTEEKQAKQLRKTSGFSW